MLARAPAGVSRRTLARHLALVDGLASAVGAEWGRSSLVNSPDHPGGALLAIAAPHEALGLALLQGAQRLTVAATESEVDDAVGIVLAAWEQPAEHALLARAARRRGIPVAWPRGGDGSWLVLGHGARAWTYVGGALAGPADDRARDVAADKLATASWLEAAGLPSTHPVAVATAAAAVREARSMGFPVVLKPSRAYAQIGVQAGLRTAADVRRAFRRATASAGWLGGPLIVERERRGVYVRATLVGGRLAAAFTARVPTAIGDGRRSAIALARAVFAMPARGALDRRSRDILRAILDAQGLRAADVPITGRRVQVGFASQGRVRDVTGDLHPALRALLQRVGQLFPLPVAGVDLIVADPTRAPDFARDVILEVNQAPSWAAHERPHSGTIRDLAPRILDVLFRAGADIRIVAGAPGSAAALERLARRERKRQGVTAAGYTRGRAWMLEPTNVIGEGAMAAALVLLDPRTTACYVEVDDVLARERGLPFERVDLVIPAALGGAEAPSVTERWLRTLVRPRTRTSPQRPYDQTIPAAGRW